MPLPTPFHPRTSAHCTSLRFKEWAGYFAVCSYDTCHDREYLAIRHGAALIDVTPLYKYELRGRQAAELLARVTVRDVQKQKVGRVSYTCWCDERGRVVDDGTVTRLDEDRFRLTSADPSYHWLARHRRGLEVEIEDVTDRIATLAIQGPTARAVLARACDADMERLPFFGAAPARFDGFHGLITRTGYTGDLGYEVWVDNDDALALYDRLLDAGRDLGARPVGLDAMDVARIEAGFILLGVDYTSSLRALIDERRSSPFELGLGWLVKLDREPFSGQAALRAEAQRGSRTALVGLELDVVELEELFDAWNLPLELSSSASREPVPLYSGGRQVGYTTSRAWSPTLKRYLALARVDAAYAATDTRLRVEVTVEHERRTIGARVVNKPFFDPERKKS